MENKIRVGISGYGNLGKGVEKAVSRSSDMDLKALFTRRDPESIKTASGVSVYPVEQAKDFQDEIDVMILCGGSATDLPKQSPEMASMFNIVDSFDTHANIPEHYDAVNQAAQENGTLGLISTGWDPGLFSLSRLLFESILPGGNTYTFWGKGVSQGHSDAIRRIDGVLDARQYTIPVEASLERVRSGENPELSTREKHTRECFVVAEEGVDQARIEEEIKTMPNYFSDYDTTVHFISQEELDRDHKGIPHGGFVIRSANTGDNQHIMEFSLNLDSNPEFTASVLTACARAVARLNAEGKTGAVTIFDLPPAYLSDRSGEELRKSML